MPELALWDLVAPYFLLGDAVGNAHAAVAALYVDDYEQASDGSSTVIRGRALFSGDIEAYFDPTTMSFGVTATNTEGHPRDDLSRRDPWIDLRDTAVDFQLVAPRIGSPVVAAGHTPIDASPDPDFAPTDAVLDAIDALPIDMPTSDYPSTDFRLELVFTTAVLRPPFLKPAKLRADGLLEPNPSYTSVSITLPKIKVTLAQDAATGTQPVLTLDSVGATGLDDSGDLSVAQLVTMDPPYAFFGDSRTVGFGFRTAVLDLSDQTTPPEVLDQFGFDPSWTGVYLPDLRLFIAKDGTKGLAVQGGVHNLLVGIGSHSGVTGDFDLNVINQGSGPLELSARFSLPDGRVIGTTSTGDGTARADLPESSIMTVDVGGRRPPYTVEINVDGGGFVTDRVASIDLSTDTEQTIVVRVSTPDAPDDEAELTITARRQDQTGGDGSIPAPSPIPQATIADVETTRSGSPVDGPLLVLESQTDESVTLAIADGSVATWTADGSPIGGGQQSRVVVPLAPGESKAIEATSNPTSTKAPIYFHFDEPDQMTDAELEEYSRVQALTHTGPSNDHGADADPITVGWMSGENVEDASAYQLALDSLSPGDNITVVGHASHSTQSSASYNLLLSERRAKVARHIYDRLAGPGNVTIDLDPRGFSEAEPLQTGDPINNPRRNFWRAELLNPINVPGFAATATIARDPVETPPPPPVPTDPPPAEPERPDWFRSVGAKVRIIRDEFIAVELYGEVDFDTATEAALRDHLDDPDDAPAFSGLGHQNPGDGIVAFRGVFTLNPGSSEWGLNIFFGADPSDVDGLVMTGSLAGQPVSDPDPGRNLLGMYGLFLPLLADVAPEKPEVSDLPLSLLSAALPAVLTATGWFTIERVVWFGGETIIEHNSGEWTTAVLLDAEIALSADIRLGADLRLITVSRTEPMVARYKAMGIRFGQGVDGELILHPVFDASKGYTLDLSKPGSLQVAEPLDKLLRVVGARVSKTNPTYLEVELGSSVDLGVIALEKAGVRIELDDPPSVELTALGVSVDVPGALTGSGYLSFNENGFAGRVDVTLTPLSIRIAAALRVEEITEGDRTATGVAVALEVEFPVAIPLWASGLGIYGFLGLFAMHFSRNEDLDAASTTKALSWLKRADGDPTQVNDPALWKADLDSWAFGVGAIVGTMGSSIVFNMKGVVLLELPGPRLLLMMKANVLFPMPELEGDGEGTLLAVIDLDVGRSTLTIGISIDFTINPILELKIPIEAFFNGSDPPDWHLFLGKFHDQIRASVFGVFEGSGYLMLMGDGDNKASELSPALPVPSGFAIATGLHVSMLWGDRSIRLYAELSAGFDAIMGFSPLLVAGSIYARGELRLFIISLSAYAQLDVRLGELPGSDPPDTGYRIHGEVCGELDLFFFSIKGCVDFTLEDDEPPEIAIPPLVEGVSMISRSPALVHGTASDDPVDGAFGNAIAGAEPNWASLPADPADDTPEQARIRKVADVPINVIPAVLFGAAPIDTGVEFKSEDPNGTSGGKPVTRSTDTITYTLRAVDLIGPISPGPTPAAWWTLRPPTEDNESAQLALLSWVPNATPKALQRSEQLETTITDRWGTVCNEAAPATAVLWTFLQEPLGPSATGWNLDGEPWPDPPDTVRSVPTPTELDVADRWRCGDPMVDEYRGILPATVVGALVYCLPDGQKDDDDAATDTLEPPSRDVGDLLDRDILTTVDPEILTAVLDARTPTLSTGRPDVAGRLAASVSTPGGARRNSGRNTPDETRSADRRFTANELANLSIDPDALAALGLNQDVLDAAIATRSEERPVLSAGRRVVGGKAKEKLVEPTTTASGLLTSLSSGGPVSRSSVGSVATQKVTSGIDGLDTCESRLLAAPRWDTLEPPEGDPDFADDMKQRWDVLGFDPGDLRNAVTMTPGCFNTGRLLLFVPASVLERGNLIVRSLDEEGAILEEVHVDMSHVIDTATMPAQWADPTGPWFDDMIHLVQHLALMQALDMNHRAVLVELNPEHGHHMVIGLGELDDGPNSVNLDDILSTPLYFVAAIEALMCAEVIREDYDTQTVEQDHSSLEASLGEASSEVALLEPNTSYEVTVTWAADATNADGDAVSQGDTQESFWFRTAADAPERLDPWMLTTTPYDGEKHVFGAEPLLLAFATNDVHDLFAAYGRRLEVRFNASSARHPDPAETGQPHPYPLDPSTLVPSPGAVLSPWEDTVGGIIDPDCVEVAEERIRHTVANLAIPLHPATDYLLDIHSVPADAPEGTVGDRVFRQGFTTSLFGTLGDYADYIMGSRVRHRAVPTGLAASIDAAFAGAQPQGAELDTAMQGSAIQPGIEPMEVPNRPQVFVWWETDGPEPQPVAVIIDGTEPLWRDRDRPTLVEPPGTDMMHYELTRDVWVEPIESAASDGIAGSIIRAPGGQRAVVILDPNSRGQRLRMQLQRHAFDEPFLDGALATDEFQEIVDVALNHAPWEEV